MKQIKKLFLLIIINSISVGMSNGFIINESGSFELGGDLLETGTDVITIQANNVSLDLNNKIITGGLNGITVKPGYGNIDISNGFITQVAGSGVSIGENCVGVRIRDLGIAQCGGRSVEVLGTDADNQAKNILIDNVTTNSCSTLVTSSQVILIKYADNVIMQNSAIIASGNATNDIDVIRFENAQNCLFRNVLQKNNFGASLCGVAIDDSMGCLFERTDVSMGLALSESFTGFRLINGSNENAFGFCRVLTSSSLVADAIGFEINGGSCENIFRECHVAALEGESVFGFCVAGSGTPSNTVNNVITECSVVTCSARSGNAVGLFVARADDSGVSKSRFAFLHARSGIAVGILFELTIGGNNWQVIENRCVRNIADSNADSYGINMISGSDNVFTLNIASENGSTAANQFAGVPAGSISLVTPATINTVTAPWTNLGITP